MKSAKELKVGSKVTVLLTEGEFEVIEAVVLKKAINNASVVVIRYGDAESAMKVHGPAWMESVQFKGDKRLLRVHIHQVYKVVVNADKFAEQYKALAKQRKAITDQMEALVKRHFPPPPETTTDSKAEPAKAGAGK